MNRTTVAWLLPVCVVLLFPVACMPPGPGLPEAGFSAEPTSGPAPLTVQFTDESIIVVTKGATVDTWLWDFGDGTTSEEASPEHVYQNAGAYTVSLTVTVGENTDTLTMEDFIDARDPNGPPSTPVLTPIPDGPVTASPLDIAGNADPNVTIHIQGGDNTDLSATSDATGAFAATVGLLPNALNRIFFIAENGQGSRSAPAPLEVIRDGQAPNLFIDLPEDGAELTNDTIQVAGRVADMLSGFMGLAVTVNGAAANVHEGIGTNGSFELSGVALQLGQNTVSATAMDALGNETSTSITVTRVAISGPRMSVVSGANQSGTVHDELPAPIVVRVSNEDDTPFADKTVTFRVTRSDGRLAATSGADPEGMMFQVKTDADGMARAFWRLGSDAGMGNNRVSVTSKDIAGTIMFMASAEPGPPSQINVGSGNNQRTEAGAPATEKLNAWVNDGCNGIGGVPVVFTIVAGDGALDSGSEKQATVMTDSTGHAKVSLVTGEAGGNNIVEADFDGNGALPATFMVTGVERSPDAPTTFGGMVLDNANTPVGGAEVLLFVNGVAQDPTTTDEEGQFLFTGIPAGPAHGHVDGGVATTLNGADIPAGSFPALPFETTIVANAENHLPRPLFLPTLNPANAVTYDGTTDVELTVEGVEGLRMIVKAGSMTRADGSIPSPGNPAVLSLNQVHYDDIPMPMPDGVAPAFAWTLQPSESRFDPPIEVIYPNVSGLPAGAAAYFLSFDHHTNKFEIVASGHVSEDASEIATDPGAGIPVAGWGGNCPPYAVTGRARNCFEVAVAFLEGGPRCPQAFPGVCPEIWGDAGFSSAFFELADTVRGLAPSRVTTKVFPRANTAESQLFAVNQWLNRLREETRQNTPLSEECPPPYLILVGHSLGGDTVRLAGDLDADVSIIAEGISRDLALDNFPGAAFYQRDQTLDGVAGIVNFIAPDTFTPEQRANCQNIGFQNFGDVECLSGFRVTGDSAIEVPGTDHRSIIESAPFQDRVIQEVLDELDLPTPPKGEPIGERLDSRFTLFANGQAFSLENDGLFIIPNITAPDQFGEGGPGTRPDFIADELISVVGVANIDGALMYARSAPFQVINGGSTNVNSFTFSDSPPPFPKQLSLAAGSVVLSPGDMTQLSTVSTLFDDTQEDVTLVADGTTYRVSSTDYITVDDEGKLSAIQNGVAIVAASNQGITSSRRVTIASDTIMTTVEGFLRDENGDPVQGATVTTTAFGGEATANAAGFFSVVLELPSTTAFVTVRTMVGETEVDSGLVPVVPGGTSDAGILAPASTAFTTTVRGTVEFEGGDPAENAAVLTSLGGQGLTDAEGAFSFLLEGNVPGGGLPPLSVTARLQLGEMTFVGEVTGVTIVPDGITTVGAITISESINLIYPGARFSIGGPPQEITKGDLNEDGNLDIVVTTSYTINGVTTAKITSILNRGDGTFGPPQSVSVGALPQDVQLADMNGDTHLDAIAAGFIDDMVFIALGNGDGSFGEAASFPITQEGLGKVAVGDIDNDGNMDVLGSSSLDGTVWVFPGNGDGTLETPTTIDIDSNNILDLGLADLNDDTNLDLVVCNLAKSRIEVFFGDGEGAFTPSNTFPTGSNPNDLMLLDIDGDDVLDAVAGNFLDGVSVLIGEGGGTFGEATTYPIVGNPRGLTANDFNGDGAPDLATANVVNNEASLSVLINNGDGTFQPSYAIGASRFTTEITSFDVDGDGFVDLLPATGASTGDIVVLRGFGDGVFDTQLTIFTGEFGNRSAVVADVNNDDRLDVITIRATDGAVLPYLGNGDGRFLEAIPATAASSPNALTVGFINGDANIDVITTHDNPARIALLFGNGDGTFGDPVILEPGSSNRAVVAVGDFDRDGAEDLVFVPSANGDIGILLGIGDGTFQNSFEIPLAGTPQSVAVANMDGDTDPDIVVAATQSGVSILLGNGDGSFQAPISGPSGSAFVAVGDLTGDGIPDVVSSDFNGGGITFAPGEGDGATGSESFFETSADDATAEQLHIADVTLDGIPDILYVDFFQVVGILAGDGTGFFSGPTRYDLGGTFNGGLDVADFDEDSQPDVVTANSGANNLSILLHR